MKLVGLLGICALLFVSCEQHVVEHKGRTPLVKVVGNYLYEEDLRKVLPTNISKDDSLLFAEYYIKNWIEDILLFDNAERNIPEDANIDQLVENYRRTLILHTYQQRLIEQKLAKEITDDEISNYYKENANQFLLEKPLIKGLFIKVPLKASGVNNVRQWYKKKDQDIIEKLEKYSLQSAVGYDYFYDRWIPVDEMVDEIPLAVTNPIEYILEKRHVEVKDTAFWYFLNVDDYLNIGKQKPLEFAKAEIKEILTNLKRIDFMKRVKGELYEQAVEKNRIEYYYLNINE